MCSTPSAARQPRSDAVPIMENRFGVKDFIALLFVCVLIVLVLLAMRQFDRQFADVVTIKDKQEQLAQDLTRIKRQIADMSASGVAMASPVTPSTNPSGAAPAVAAGNAKIDAFAHMREVEKLPGFARGGWFLDNFGTKVGKLTPLISTDVYASWIQNMVMETLAVRDPYTLDYVPRLAKRWDTSADGLTM